MAESGRWVKLTAESAQKVKQFGLMPSKTPGVSHAMIGAPGHIRGWLQLESGVDPVTELTHGGHSFQDP